MLHKWIIALFLLLGLTACGQQVYNSSLFNRSLPELTVQAEATVQATPDLLQMRLGVVTEAVNAGTAMAENNQRMKALMDMLTAIGIAEEELTTGQFQIGPQWSVPPRPTPANWRREIVAYRVTNELNVSTTKVDLAGELLGLAQKSGANQIGGLQFGLADPEEHRQLAISAAALKAKRKAQTLADAAGIELGPIMSLSLDPVDVFDAPQLMKLERAMVDTETVPVASGKVDVKAGVTIVYRLVN